MKAQRAYAKRWKKTLKEQAHFVFKHRHLIVTREENLTEQQRKDLRKMFQYLPALRTLRTFAERLYLLFAAEQSEHQAYCRRAALMQHAAFAQFPNWPKPSRCWMTCGSRR